MWETSFLEFQFSSMCKNSGLSWHRDASDAPAAYFAAIQQLLTPALKRVLYVTVTRSVNPYRAGSCLKVYLASDI